MLRKQLGFILNALTHLDVFFKFRKLDLPKFAEFNDSNITVIVFASFNLKNFEYEYLVRLSEFLDRAQIYIIDNGISESAICDTAKVKYIRRKNVSRDLGSLRDFLVYANMNRLNCNILFINSSCIWDPNLLAMYVLQLENIIDEVVFGTDSYQHNYHAQTFLIWIGKLELPRVISILGDAKVVKNWVFKRSVVFKVEKRIIAELMKRSVKVSILFPATRFVKLQNLKKVNPSYDLRRDLIISVAPFYKKGLPVELEDFPVFNQNDVSMLINGRYYPPDLKSDM